MSNETGRLIVDIVSSDRRPSEVMTRESFLNAIVAVAAVGVRRTRSCTCSPSPVA